jgi:hypothetical protein
MIELVTGQQQQQHADSTAAATAAGSVDSCTPEQQQQQDADSAAATAAGNIDNCTPDQQQQQLCDALSCLALHAECDEDVRRQLCSSPALLQRLTQLLQAQDLHTAQLAAHLVWYISRSAELRLFLQQQAQLLPALLGLLAGQDVAAARAAAFALNNCAHEQSFRFAVLEAGAVPCLVEMLSGCDALGQEVSVMCDINSLCVVHGVVHGVVHEVMYCTGIMGAGRVP